MTTESPDDLDDFMKELDQSLKPQAKAKGTGSAKKSTVVYLPPPPQQWFPHGTTLFCTRQTCRHCNSTFVSVDGRYLVDVSRNGALRRVRLEEKSPIPESYVRLPRTVTEDLMSIDLCPNCFNPAITTKETS